MANSWAVKNQVTGPRSARASPGTTEKVLGALSSSSRAC